MILPDHPSLRPALHQMGLSATLLPGQHDVLAVPGIVLAQHLPHTPVGSCWCFSSDRVAGLTLVRVDATRVYHVVRAPATVLRSAFLDDNPLPAEWIPVFSAS